MLVAVELFENVGEVNPVTIGLDEESMEENQDVGDANEVEIGLRLADDETVMVEDVDALVVTSLVSLVCMSVDVE